MCLTMAKYHVFHWIIVMRDRWIQCLYIDTRQFADGSHHIAHRAASARSHSSICSLCSNRHSIDARLKTITALSLALKSEKRIEIWSIESAIVYASPHIVCASRNMTALMHRNVCNQCHQWINTKWEILGLFGSVGSTPTYLLEVNPLAAASSLASKLAFHL